MSLNLNNTEADSAPVVSWPKDLHCNQCPLVGVCPGHQELKGAVPCKNYLTYSEWVSTIRIKIEDLD